jgi:hypothetical protein
MTHIAVQWHHGNPDDPVELYSELDEQRYEVRKVEVFRDGRRCFADGPQQSGRTRLGIVPVPPLEEIASDRQFTPRVITPAEFEAAWEAAVDRG